MTSILVIEDDRKTAAEIAAALTDVGHDVECVHDGKHGLLKAAAGTYDAIVLDRMLPGLDGLGVLATLRAADVDVPVLILSAMSAVDERVRGLRAGGDDYLTKPFDFVELTARVDALTRRRDLAPSTPVLASGDLVMDPLTRTARYRGRKLDLLPREYQLLAYLMRQPGHVVTRTMIFEEVWGYRTEQRTNVIDVHIAKLRRKLDDAGATPMIETIRGAGYVLRETV